MMLLECRNLDSVTVLSNNTLFETVLISINNAGQRFPRNAELVTILLVHDLSFSAYGVLGLHYN